MKRPLQFLSSEALQEAFAAFIQLERHGALEEGSALDAVSEYLNPNWSVPRVTVLMFNAQEVMREICIRHHYV